LERLRSSLPVPFAVGGACLLRKGVFAALGGFDPAFEPFYLEDLDLGWRAWREGFTCMYVGASVVEHHNRGTIGAVIPKPVVLTAIERNRLLFTWKHLDERRAIEQHLRELRLRVAEARVLEERTLLTALCLALEDRSQVVAAGRKLPPVEEACFERIRAASDPFRAA
jgi:GT2 family glycosyltransferase